MFDEFYRRYLKEFDIVQYTLFGDDNGGVYANKNVLWHLKDTIEELKEFDFEKDVYFILPRGTNEEIIEYVEEAAVRLIGCETDYEIISYDEDVDLLVLEDNSLSGAVTVKNPYIIYNNMDDTECSKNVDDYVGYHVNANSTICKADKEELEVFVEEFGLENHICRITNVWEQYEETYQNIRQTTIISVMLMVLLVILECFVIRNVLTLEYTANAVELSVKKVLGYGIFEKNRKVILSTVITSAICIVISAFAAENIVASSMSYVLAGGFILLGIEVVMILFAIRKIEKNSVQKILKGGAL